MSDYELPLLVVLTIISQVVAHRLSSARNLKNKKRNLVTKYLIDAYKDIESATNSPSFDSNRKLEQAVANVQLLGDKIQIKLAKDFAQSMNDSNTAKTKKLLEELRLSLRKELDLDVTDEEIVHLRMPHK